MNNKIVSIIAIFALVVALVALAKPIQTAVQDIAGGLIHNVAESFDEGIEVDGKRLVTGDGGIIKIGQVYDFGESASASITAQMLCEGQDNIAYNFFTIDADGSGDDIGASISFDDDETFTAIQDCIEDQGDGLSFIIDPTSSTSTTYVDITITGLVNIPNGSSESPL